MDVTTFLDTLHSKYSKWITKCTTADICAVNSERTLTGAISEVPVLGITLSMWVILCYIFSES